MGTITSANSVLLIGITGLFTVAQKLQGFGSDDMYAMDDIDTAEVVMGVDGKMSQGWVPQIKTMNIVLQADSASNDFFETWYNAQEAQQESMVAFGILNQPSVGRSYALTQGALSGYSPLAAAKKVLQPRKFAIKWAVALGAPI